MRRLLEWLDVGTALSGAIHVTAGLVCLAAVSAFFFSNIPSIDAAPSDPQRSLALLADSDPGPTEVAVASSGASAQPAGPGMIKRAGDTSLMHAAVARPMMQIKIQNLESERQCLTEGIYYEARGESTAGQLAVAEVILNRVAAGRYADTICGVIMQGKTSNQCQFSFVCNGDMDKPREHAAWRRAERVAALVLGGEVRNSLIGGATYYHASYVNPSWKDRMVEVKKIGQHIFYQLAGERRS